MVTNMDKCPVCFNNLIGYGSSGYSGFTDDPLLTPSHPIPSCRGDAQPRIRHIVELRQRVNYLELQAGLALTQWTNIVADESAIRIQYINELRVATEALIIASGSTLAEYLSMDENGEPTLGISGWSDGNRLSSDYIVRAINIEELRKAIIALGYNTLFCTSNYGAYSNPLLANERVEGDSGYSGADRKWFQKGILIDNNLQGFIDNMFNYFFLQTENQFLYAFNLRRNGTPLVSWLPSLKKIDKSEWLGWEPWGAIGNPYAYEAYSMVFDPPLPYNEAGIDYPSYRCEGITSMAIDDTNEDYYLYTTEFFYSRCGLGGSASDYGYYGMDNGAPNCVARYSYPKVRVIGTGTGLPNQNFNSSSAGIYVPIPVGAEWVYVDGVIWTRVSSFNSSTATDNHYTINNNSGVVTFGDGSKGVIPPSGSEIKIFITLGGSWSGPTPYSGYSGGGGGGMGG